MDSPQQKDKEGKSGSSSPCSSPLNLPCPSTSNPIMTEILAQNLQKFFKRIQGEINKFLTNLNQIYASYGINFNAMQFSKTIVKLLTPYQQLQKFQHGTKIKIKTQNDNSNQNQDIVDQKTFLNQFNKQIDQSSNLKQQSIDEQYKVQKKQEEIKNTNNDDNQNLSKIKQQYFQFNDAFSLNEKLQKLTNLFKIQLKKVPYNNQSQRYLISCWICKQTIFSPKQQNTRTRCIKQFILHFQKQHMKQTLQRYCRGKNKKIQLQQISYQKYLDKIKQYQSESSNSKLKQVYIIDRQNAGKFQKPGFIQRKQEWIEILNRNNKHLAKGLMIVANSIRKDAADILMTALTYQLISCNYAESVTLVTKDHFGETLIQVFKDLSMEKIKCVHPKEFNQK